MKHETYNIDYNYVNCYGVTLTDAEVNEYNRITREVEKWQAAGLAARLSDLDARHKIMARRA